MIASTLIALSLSAAPPDLAMLASIAVCAPQQERKRPGRGQDGGVRQDGGRTNSEGASGTKARGDKAKAGGSKKANGIGKAKAAKLSEREARAAERAKRPPRTTPPADNRPPPNWTPNERVDHSARMSEARNAKPHEPKAFVRPETPTEEERERARAAASRTPVILKAPELKKLEVGGAGSKKASGAIRLDIEQTRAIALEQKKHRERLARIHRLIELAALLERNDSNQDLTRLQKGELDRHERVLASWRKTIGDRSLRRALQIADGD